MNRKIPVLVFAGAVLAGGGCNTAQTYQANEVKRSVLVSRTTARSAAYRGPLRNPVVFVHGLLGANLAERGNGANVWGEFKMSQFRDPQHWRKLALPPVPRGQSGEPACPVVPTGLLEQTQVRLLGMSFSLDNYDRALELLEFYGYSQNDPNGTPSLFIFAYDWRLSVPENAASFDKFLRRKRAMLQKRYAERYKIDHCDIRFDVVAHSMGGLITRYYIQYGPAPLPEDGTLPKNSDEGSDLLEKVLIVGTPNAGYVDTVRELVDGLQLVPMGPRFPPAVIGTFRSYYCMLPQPHGKHVVWSDNPNGPEVDIFDPQVWIDLKWGLADPRQDIVLQALLPHVKSAEKRREIALELLSENLRLGKQFAAAMRHPMKPKPNIRMVLFAGDAFETNRTLGADRRTGRLSVLATESGDGKILATSTRFDLRDYGMRSYFMHSPIPWHSIYYFGATHMALLSCTEFDSNMSLQLLNFPTPRQLKLAR